MPEIRKAIPLSRKTIQPISSSRDTPPSPQLLDDGGDASRLAGAVEVIVDVLGLDDATMPADSALELGDLPLRFGVEGDGEAVIDRLVEIRNEARAGRRFEEADAIRDEKVKVLQAVRPLQGEAVHHATVRGQYDGYASLDGVGPASRTATFAAVRLSIDNWRWQGVPFYLRSGKAMSCRTSQIVIQYREPPIMMFGDGPRSHLDANKLVIQIQPAEGIQMHLQSKVPDAGMKLRTTNLDFRFAREFTGTMPDSYQRLLLDAMNGDASLFARHDEVEVAWSIIDPILAAWQSPAAPPLETYPTGDWGPACSDEWMRAQGREWFDVCPVLH